MAGPRVGPHQAVAHRSEFHPLLRGEIRETELTAGEQQRVLGDQILDLGLGLGVERIVGSSHISKLGIATSGRNDASGQQRVFCGYRLERRIRMPQPIAEIERAPAIIPRQQVAVLIEIRDVAHLDAEPALVEPRYVVGRVQLDLAEASGECDLLFVGQWLLVEHQHRMPVHAGMYRRYLSRIERRAQIDAFDHRGEFVSDRVEPHGHLRVFANITRSGRGRHAGL